MYGFYDSPDDDNPTKEIIVYFDENGNVIIADAIVVHINEEDEE
jgi:hypothetical protein